MSLPPEISAMATDLVHACDESGRQVNELLKMVKKLRGKDANPGLVKKLFGFELSFRAAAMSVKTNPSPITTIPYLSALYTLLTEISSLCKDSPEAVEQIGLQAQKIVQPLLGFYKTHGEEINFARASLQAIGEHPQLSLLTALGTLATGQPSTASLIAIPSGVSVAVDMIKNANSALLTLIACISLGAAFAQTKSTKPGATKELPAAEDIINGFIRAATTAASYVPTLISALRGFAGVIEDKVLREQAVQLEGAALSLKAAPTFATAAEFLRSVDDANKLVEAAKEKAPVAASSYAQTAMQVANNFMEFSREYGMPLFNLSLSLSAIIAHPYIASLTFIATCFVTPSPSDRMLFDVPANVAYAASVISTSLTTLAYAAGVAAAGYIYTNYFATPVPKEKGPTNA